MSDDQLAAWQELVQQRTRERDQAHAEVLALQNQYTHQHAIAQEEHTRAEAAEAEVERLRVVLADIASATDVNDPESYRCDDREGCLDYVYAKATYLAGKE